MSITKVEVQGVNGHMDHEHDKDRGVFETLKPNPNP